jgi:hypothetical protein|tara:strand:+ start:586 stop:900 length:315 start_codon:yes stop_codon:yes gene_type:complete
MGQHYDCQYNATFVGNKLKFESDYDSDKQIGEIEISIKIPTTDKADYDLKESAENKARIIMSELINPKWISEIRLKSTVHKEWGILRKKDESTLDLLSLEVVNK